MKNRPLCNGRLLGGLLTLLFPRVVLRQGALDDDSLFFEDLPSVFSASKYEQRLSEAPASVSIVTADEIRNCGYRTLEGILDGVRGFHTTNDRNYAYPGIRGFNRPGDHGTRILLLRDSQRLNDGLYDAVIIDRELTVDVDLIDRVEFVRGTKSSLYGSNAVLGVIDVITKRGRDLKGAGLGTPSTAGVTIRENDAPPGDSNGDGMSDVVAIALGLDPNDPDADSDVDGLIDAMEPGASAADAMIASGPALVTGDTVITTTAAGEMLSQVRATAAPDGPAGIDFPL